MLLLVVLSTSLVIVRIFVVFCFFFFFFKQKTAYEMQRGLVGSEMCIRDSQRRSKEISLSIYRKEKKGSLLSFIEIIQSFFPSMLCKIWIQLVRIVGEYKYIYIPLNHLLELVLAMDSEYCEYICSVFLESLYQFSSENPLNLQPF
eukprot:TRINITY_DN4482_c0_g1_i2.p1 TRINITY_DN4482_c0_g1~~TRINITY_DN4482_c0_g1_i2.p1  ORF type:complete len:146 (-),score=29.73 TRINITY_DN4482_c0_g1_i2:225-662(-)